MKIEKLNKLNGGDGIALKIKKKITLEKSLERKFFIIGTFFIFILNI